MVVTQKNGARSTLKNADDCRRNLTYFVARVGRNRRSCVKVVCQVALPAGCSTSVASELASPEVGSTSFVSKLHNDRVCEDTVRVPRSVCVYIYIYIYICISIYSIHFGLRRPRTTLSSGSKASSH